MIVDRRRLGIGLGATLFGSVIARAGMAGQISEEAAQPSAGRAPFLYKNATFEYTFQVCCGRTYYSVGNLGKVLYIAGQVENGDYANAYRQFKQAGDEALALAGAAAKQGHRESARQAYLWAASYYDSATYFIDGTGDSSPFLPTWELLDHCWVKAATLSKLPVEPILIPYENTELRGFFLRCSPDDAKRPLLILNNGSDGSLLDMWTIGGAGAVARGYNCLMFDGPGQGYALWKQKLYFRPDWERVITPVVDYALTRNDVDPERITLQGVSQGGYWVPRAVAFEKRIAAAIADPGVVDVSSSWTSGLPAGLLRLLNEGNKTEFDQYISEADPETLDYLRFRMRPYGLTSYYDVFKAVERYTLKDVVDRISCPMLITAPVNESFWPGQSRLLYDLLRAPKEIVPFTVADGADTHCEPGAYGLRDLRVHDWLDALMRPDSPA